MSSKLWITDEGTFIRNPAELGYAETDCGPDFLTRGSAYCEPVTKIRVTTIAVDSIRYRNRYFDTIEAAAAWVRKEGLTGDGGVSLDGVVRFADAAYRVGAGSYFFLFKSLSAFLKAAA